MIEQVKYYKIADLHLEITISRDYDLASILPNFEPFASVFNPVTPVSCHVYFSHVDLDFDKDSSKLLSDISIVWGDRFTFYETEDFYWTLIENDQKVNSHWKMRSSKDFKYNTIYCGNISESKNNFISWYCMVAFAQSALMYKCVLIHSSVVMNQSYGYAFLGKSGTGKSTHSRLWLDHNEGFSLLNDDNPAMRVVNNDVFIYGTPWSGKTKCYVNDFRQLRGLIRLNQAPRNQFTLRQGKEALLALLPSCSAIRWNQALYSSLITTLIEVIEKTLIGELYCLPDGEAAHLCYQSIESNKR